MTNQTRKRNTFAFAGGEILTTIGATFFVSYLYHRHVDKMHRNWEGVGTSSSRIKAIDQSTHYHRAWLDRVGFMKEINLNKNTLGLTGVQVKAMAKAILDRVS
tara:strand:+ start:153 stop:461 length:309 start_codon:yes stop_codon:yes gene_type:complete